MQLISVSKSAHIFFKSFALTLKDMSGIFLIIAMLAGIGFELAHVWFANFPHSIVYDCAQALFTVLALCYAFVRFGNHKPNVKAAVSYFVSCSPYIIVPIILIAILNCISSESGTMAANTTITPEKGLQAFLFLMIIGFVHIFFSYLLALSALKKESFVSILRQWITSAPKIILAVIVFALFQFVSMFLLLSVVGAIAYILLFIATRIAPSIPTLSIVNFANTVASVFSTGIINAVAGYFAATLAWNATYGQLPKDYEK